MTSNICVGNIRHRRYLQHSHQFNYKLFMMLLDLEQLPHLFDDYRFWSVDRFNLAQFQRKRYFGDHKQPLLDSAKSLVMKKTGQQIDRVMLLTHLTYFGYCFNPISLYFCYQQQKLTHCIAEVSNTPWGESHPYVLTLDPINTDVYQVDFKKLLFVSPFLNMDYRYHMKLKINPQHIIVHIENWQQQQCHFDATLKLTRQPINHKNLANALIKHPFMTGKVITAIHWQALKLWFKGVSLQKHKGKVDDD